MENEEIVFENDKSLKGGYFWIFFPGLY